MAAHVHSHMKLPMCLHAHAYKMRYTIAAAVVACLLLEDAWLVV